MSLLAQTRPLKQSLAHNLGRIDVHTRLVLACLRVLSLADSVDALELMCSNCVCFDRLHTLVVTVDTDKRDLCHVVNEYDALEICPVPDIAVSNIAAYSPEVQEVCISFSGRSDKTIVFDCTWVSHLSKIGDSVVHRPNHHVHCATCPIVTVYTICK